ncbi:hypothetical protein DSO57_1013847 [Entomophthora muscae]|uniref:Uncharacterized protein n=2 Tax=Entomophthora muscae TaxID=34485 RepID=A0ACC2T5H6_9FUNG|nr:hypothetical protein DSO57_1019933 [Entomophthora muscae]KAJ9069909.1 hypothetical protein DSO57_1013847 [Entomophthora muscae]
MSSYSSIQEDLEQHTLDVVLNTVNSVSLVGAVLVVLVVWISSYFGCHAAKRLSFRLSMWIALADFVFCGISYLNISTKRVISCNIITSVGYISNLTYIFLTMCMAFNLQMVFVQQQHNPRLTEKFYVGASFLAAVVIVLPFTVIAVAMDSCTLFRMVTLPYNLGLFWLMIGIWEVGGVVYCSVTIVKVVLKLTRFHDDISGLQGTASPSVDRISDSIQSRVEQVVRRLVFYPLIPVLTQTPYIIAANFSLLNEGDKSLIERYIYYVPSYSAGLLNAAVFLFDPALPEILKDLRNYLHTKYHKDPSPTARFIARVSKLPDDPNMHRLSKQSQSFFHSNLILVPPESGDSSSSSSPNLSRANSQQTPGGPMRRSLHYDETRSARSSLYSTNSTRDMSENQVTLLL